MKWEPMVNLRIYTDESRHHNGRPVYGIVFEESARLGLSGATVTRADMGFGTSKHFHSARIVDISADLPVVLEFMDTRDKVMMLADVLDKAGVDCLAVATDCSAARLGMK